MLHECVHSGGISCIYRKGNMGFVHLYFNYLGSCIVSWGLCYNSVIGNAILISFTISDEIVFITLEMFNCDSHISIHIIYLALRHSCRSVLVLAMKLAILNSWWQLYDFALSHCHGPHVVFRQGIRSSILNEWCSRSRGYKQDILWTFMSELRLNSWHALTKLLRNRVNKLTRCWIFTIVVPEPEIRTPRGRKAYTVVPDAWAENYMTAH